LAVAAVVVRYLAYKGVVLPPVFLAKGFLLLLIAYLVLVAGNLVEGA
jgi:membrane protein CcdC involved in cytochrome C biogenesis